MLTHARWITAAGHLELGRNGDLHVEGRLVAGVLLLGNQVIAPTGSLSVVAPSSVGIQPSRRPVRVDVGDRLSVVLDRGREAAVQTPSMA